MQSNYETTGNTGTTGTAGTTGHTGTTGTTTAPHTADVEHDQSTINSPTDYHHTEKYGQDQTGAAGGTVHQQGKFSKTVDVCCDNPIVTYGLRFWQWVFAVISLGLAAYSLDKFYADDTRMRLVIFTACLTLVYFIVLFLLAFLRPTLLIAGALMVMELLITIFWLCSFVSATARFSHYSCSRSSSSSLSYNSGYTNGYSNMYSSGTKVRGCHTGKAACAFSAIAFLLFALSSMMLFWNVIRPLLRRRMTSALFTPGSSSGVRLNKNGLAFSKYYDINEGTTTYGHNHTGSSATDATYGQTGEAGQHGHTTQTYGQGGANQGGQQMAENNGYYVPNAEQHTAAHV